MNAADVRLEGIRVRLGGRDVLTGLDLYVAAGTTTVVLGPSGSGKSTLLRVVAGLLEPDAGRVTIGGTVVADPGARVAPERRGVGMVFQSLELFPHLDVVENVAFGLPGRPRGAAAAADRRVGEVLDAVGLPVPLRRRRPADLSGGERQRVAIARSLAPGPRVLLYDEPLVGTDPSRRAELRALVRALVRARSTTGIYVTHDAAEAMELGDEVAVLCDGLVLERGAPERLRAAPRTLAVARAFGPVCELAGEEAVRLGLVASAGDGLLVLRPEHLEVAPDGTGAAASVVDAWPSGDRFLVEARLGAREGLLRGLARARPAAGAAVRLRVVGAPPVVPVLPSRNAP